MKTSVVTIVSANYLAYAKVLGTSVAAHMPGASFTVLIVDRKTEELLDISRELPFGAVWAEDLGIPDFERIAYKFDILELNTALKPTLLKRMLSKGFESVIYFDPDVCLFSEPTPVLHALETYSAVLTPHSTTPLMDGSRPSDIDLMRAGAYNLGFIALKRDLNSEALLDWWEARCLGYGFVDPVEGLFVDQKWLDLAPCYFDGVGVLKHRGCNVAYWNLHERPIAKTEESITAGGHRLVFFHFSGVDADRTGVLSRYQNRHALASRTVLSTLVETYCSRLKAAGHDTYFPLAYSFGVLSDGTKISTLMRRAIECLGIDERAPFDTASPFQATLRRVGLVASGAGSASMGGRAPNALTFDPEDPRIRWVNWGIRATAKLIGIQRTSMLLKYFTFLSRGANLVAVLSSRPFDFRHELRRPVDAAIADPLPRESIVAAERSAH